MASHSEPRYLLRHRVCTTAVRLDELQLTMYQNGLDICGISPSALTMVH